MKYAIIPADGNAPIVVEGTLVTPQNRATYIGRNPELAQYAFAPTGATAGAPGKFTPIGATPPTNLSALQAGGVTASPATNWTTGQSVKLGDETSANWNGTTWVAGVHA